MYKAKWLNSESLKSSVKSKHQSFNGLVRYTCIRLTLAGSYKDSTLPVYFAEHISTISSQKTCTFCLSLWTCDELHVKVLSLASVNSINCLDSESDVRVGEKSKGTFCDAY